MRFLFLWIRKNYRYRAGNCILPLTAFFAAALLLSVTVLYVTMDLRAFDAPVSLPFDLRTAGRNETAAELIKSELAGTGEAALLAETPYVDLYPYYRDEIAAFDVLPPHRTLCLSFVGEDSGLAPFYKEHGCDVSQLAENEVYIAPYVRYYLAAHIEGDRISLPEWTDGAGNPLCLVIRGVMEPALAEQTDAALLSSSVSLCVALRAQSGTDSSMLFYTVQGGTEEAAGKLYTPGLEKLHADLHLYAQTGDETRQTVFASGDLAIVLCSLIFAFCGMLCTVRLKADREAGDRMILENLGLSPVHRALLFVFDLLPLGCAAFAMAFPTAVFLFRCFAPESTAAYRSEVMLCTYRYHPAQLRTALCLFFALFAVVLLSELRRSVFRRKKKTAPFVRQSARFYYSGRGFLPRYLLLRCSRNRAAALYLVFLFCFPLIVCAVYGTAGAAITDNGRVLYADTDIFIGRDYLAAGTAVTEETARKIAALTGVEAVCPVRHTGIPLSASFSEYSAEIMPTELNAYTVSALSAYCTDGSLSAVSDTPDTAAVIDNAGLFRVGDALRLKDKTLTVGAVLSVVPLEDAGMIAEYQPLYVSLETLRSLSDAELLPEDLHICLSDSITAQEEIEVRRMLPLLLYDPHAFAVFRRDTIAVQNQNGFVSYRTVSVMNVLIVCTAVLSVFLFIAQNLLARYGELSVLYRLGYSRGQLTGLVLAEYASAALPAFLGFAAVYGYYLSRVTAAIAEMQTYQYAGFSPAVREILLTAAALIAAMVSAVLLTVREKKAL